MTANEFRSLALEISGATESSLIDLLGSIAERKKATPARIALAWLLARSRGLFRSRAPRSCIAWRKTSARSQSN
jgi:hypothetical protein